MPRCPRFSYLAAGGGDRQKVPAFEAGAADQRAVDVWHGQQFRGVGRASPSRRRACGRPRPPRRSSADELAADAARAFRRLRPRSASGRCRSPRPARRRPRVCAVAPSGSEPGSCRADHRQRPAGLALGLGLADADDRRSGRRAIAAVGLGAHQRVGLAMIGAPLGMADDDLGGAGVGSIGGGDVAGMGAADGSAWQSWPPTRDAAARSRRAGARSASPAGRPALRPARPRPRTRVADRRDLGERRREAVHLPVSGDERTDVGSLRGAPGSDAAIAEAGQSLPSAPAPSGPRQKSRMAPNLLASRQEFSGCDSARQTGAARRVRAKLAKIRLEMAAPLSGKLHFLRSTASRPAPKSSRRFSPTTPLHSRMTGKERFPKVFHDRHRNTSSCDT